MGRTLAHRTHTQRLIGSVEPGSRKATFGWRNAGRIRPPKRSLRSSTTGRVCPARLLRADRHAAHPRHLCSGFVAPQNKYVPVARRPSPSPNALACTQPQPTTGTPRVHHLAPQALSLTSPPPHRACPLACHMRARNVLLVHAAHHSTAYQDRRGRQDHP